MDQTEIQRSTRYDKAQNPTTTCGVPTNWKDQMRNRIISFAISRYIVKGHLSQ